jgi:Zn-dependent peptidase ImmA (M78 family)
MSSYTDDQLSAARLALCDPYAFMEELEGEIAQAVNKPTDSNIHYTPATLEQVRASRELLQNPYAYLNGEGNFEGTLKASSNDQALLTAVDERFDIPSTTKDASERKSIQTPRKYTEKQIQAIARQIQIAIWKNKNDLWNGRPPEDPIELLSPSHAMLLKGFSLEFVPGFGPIMRGQDIAEIAGYLDYDKKITYISEQFTAPQQLFTSAHELGHILLHGDSIGRIHRDRPTDGSNLSRDYIEWAADKFAAYFLMPEKLVKKAFKQRFRTEHLNINEDVAFGLGFSNIDELRKKIQNKKQLAQLVAGTTHYHANHFKSLAAQFRVSVGAMAIRLEEFGLIKY